MNFKEDITMGTVLKVLKVCAPIVIEIVAAVISNKKGE